MFEPYLPVIALAGLLLLLVLCLPIARLQKVVLEFTAWILRLALLALLGAAVYLWFYPANLPAEGMNTSNNFLNTVPSLKGVVPEPGTPYFGICAAACVVGVLVPLLAVLDVSRKLAGRRLRRLRALADAPRVAAAPPQPVPVPAVHRVNRLDAAEALAEAASRKPLRAP
jgi:hypothetical protein